MNLIINKLCISLFLSTAFLNTTASDPPEMFNPVVPKRQFKDMEDPVFESKPFGTYKWHRKTSAPGSGGEVRLLVKLFEIVNNK